MISVIADICSGELGNVHREIGELYWPGSPVCSVFAPAFGFENSSVEAFFYFLMSKPDGL